jgi:hypothetical protein
MSWTGYVITDVDKPDVGMAMAERGWTAYRLGKESGVAPSDVTRWLDPTRADHQPHITTKRLEPILAALNLTLKKNNF